jgi:hypothetical protein
MRNRLLGAGVLCGLAVAVTPGPASAASLTATGHTVLYSGSLAEPSDFVQAAPLGPRTMEIGLNIPVGSAPIKLGKGCVAKTKRFRVRGRLRTRKVAVCTLGFSTLVPTLLVRLGGGEDFGRIGPTSGEKASEWKVTLRGDDGADELYDEPSGLMKGKVTLSGGEGDDKLSSKYSGRSGDLLNGGDGDDTLLIDNGKADGSVDCGAGTDTLTRDALDVTPLNCETVTP